MNDDWTEWDEPSVEDAQVAHFVAELLPRYMRAYIDDNKSAVEATVDHLLRLFPKEQRPALEKVVEEYVPHKTAAPFHEDQWQAALPWTELFHVTDHWTWENKIQHEGLRPQGEHGEESAIGQSGWGAEDTMRSRPGHVYLGTDFDVAVDRAKQDPDLVVLEVDPKQLQPALIDADEDAYVVNPELHAGLVGPENWTHDQGGSWGGWADIHTEHVDHPDRVPQAMAQSKSIAYRGVVPASAIKMVPIEETEGAGQYVAKQAAPVQQWVYVRGVVEMGSDELHELGRRAAAKAGLDETTVARISNLIARGQVPPDKDVAAGTVLQGRPHIWMSTVDRNAVMDAVLYSMHASAALTQ